MTEINNIENIIFSQMSLSTFKKCPLKFKLKYIDGIRWKNSSPVIRHFAEVFEKGKKFHLLAERYFQGISTDFERFKEEEPEIYEWIDKLKEYFVIKKEHTYLPEYQLRMIEDPIRLQAKYDLIVDTKGELQVWDWKTAGKRLKRDKLEQSFQTIVYLYLLKEKSELAVDRNVNAEDIKMIYLQPNYIDSPVVIDYTEEKHKRFEEVIKNTIDTINNYDFMNDFDKSLYRKHCKYCEFNFLCNNERINLFKSDDEEIIDEIDWDDIEEIAI